MPNHRIDPATKAMAVTPSDTVDMTDSGKAVICRGISLGTGGDVAFKDENGVTRVAKSLAAGLIHPISTGRIMATGTTALVICVYW